MFSLSASLRSSARAAPRPLLALTPRAARMASRKATQASRLVSRNEELAREEVIVDELQETSHILENAPVLSGPASDSFSVDIQSDPRKALRTRLPNFIKPTDFKDRSDDERIHRRRPLLGPDALQSRQVDPFHILGIDPLVEATNPKLLSYFVTEMGKVRSRAENRLTWHSQRRLTRAIRRAKNMGVIPALSRSITLRNP